MSHPDLYRAGNTTSPRYDNVRPQDIPVVDGKVKPHTGGVSTFAAKDPSWPANKTWVLERSTPLVSGLTAYNDVSNHWLLAPASEMTLAQYKSHLSSLNSKAKRYDELHPGAAVEDSAATLAHESTHNDRETRFVYNALATTVRLHLAVESWDDNDYTYIAVLASELEAGTIPLATLGWAGSETGGWSREAAFVAQAVQAYMDHAQSAAKGSEDDEADVANDHAFLRAVLKLDDASNPYFARAV